MTSQSFLPPLSNARLSDELYPYSLNMASQYSSIPSARQDTLYIWNMRLSRPDAVPSMSTGYFGDRNCRQDVLGNLTIVAWLAHIRSLISGYIRAACSSNAACNAGSSIAIFLCSARCVLEAALSRSFSSAWRAASVAAATRLSRASICFVSLSI